MRNCCLGTLAVLSEPHPLFLPPADSVFLVLHGFVIETVAQTVIVSRSRDYFAWEIFVCCMED